MGKLILTLASGVALAGFATPALAHPWDDGHDDEHGYLDDRHDDIHEQLDEEHAEAHAEGLTPWEHEQLHRDLDRQHRWADRQLRREHQRWHNRNSWEYANPYYPRYYGGYGRYGRYRGSSGVYFNFGW